ncbi:Hypothetical predicted protein [Xyrichtys novacula]|uniref:Uncharacterized protein n=1 Tax=Xyrichtys novacula TaxID=13765 RepID=A0AAV1GH39_XYRNO|nr:Hypothetical predicted protein [Xyrichtys novacula]
MAGSETVGFPKSQIQAPPPEPRYAGQARKNKGGQSRNKHLRYRIEMPAIFGSKLTRGAVCKATVSPSLTQRQIANELLELCRRKALENDTGYNLGRCSGALVFGSVWM